MLVLAQSIKGKEYLYDIKSAHLVSSASAEKIRDICNEYKYREKDGYTWYIHEIDSYSNAYYYALKQRFTIYKGSVKARYC